MDVRYGATPLSTLRGLSSTAPCIPRGAYVLVLGTRHIRCRLGAHLGVSRVAVIVLCIL